MALQIKYEIRQIHADWQASDGVHLSANVLITSYDDAGNVVKVQNVDTPDYAFAALPVPIQTTLVTLRDQIIAALKTKYNTTAVTMFVPPVQS